MLNLNKKLKISTMATAMLFLLLLPNSSAVRTSSRFFYENEPQNADLQIANDETNSSATKLSLLGENSHDEIPLEFYFKLNNVSDSEEFIDLFVQKDTIDPQLGILGKNMKRNVERANVVSPKHAKCIPVDTIVSLTPLEASKDPKVDYFPKCTRVKRCSGCCNHERISCQPTETENVNFEVKKYLYDNGAVQSMTKEIVVVEVHKSCVCGCRIKAEDCNVYQTYVKDTCSCSCINNDAKNKCLAQEHKIWNEHDCRCVCRDILSCTTGTFFDENQCKCVNPNMNGPPLEDRRRFIIKAVPVDPDNRSIYDAN